MAYDGTPVKSNTQLENGQWTGEFTGANGNKGYQYYDAASGNYVKVPLSDMPDDGGWYVNNQGEYVYGTQPAEKHYNTNTETYQEGPDPFAGVREQIPGEPTGNGVPASPIDNPNYDPDAAYPEFNPVPSDPDYADGVTFGEGGGGGGGGNSSWDWSKFQSSLPVSPDAPPYSSDFTLGEDSPWGNEGTPGGNAEFYNQQFNNLNRQSQNHQKGQVAAALRRMAASQNPQEAPEMDWSWANNGQGLPEVQVQGDAGSPRYGLREGFDTNTTNYEIMNAALGAGWADQDSGYPVGPDNPQLSGTNWANATSPTDLYASMPAGADATWSDMLRKGMNYAFTDNNIESPTGGGPIAAPGYASPIGSK
jgi:hypothetical protein